ncbi:MAG TPA: type IV pili twitching motility protein PilT, partial [Xanthomonadales bacterium]|nr:type IV pili twitching motility protein PilT [Xanthomonadales bacterium]
VISLRLVVGIDGKRLPAAEILINTPMIRDLMRRGEVHAIKEAMEKSLQEGMQTFDTHLFRLYKEGKVTLEEALNKADSRDGLALRVRLSEGASAEHDPYAEMYN